MNTTTKVFIVLNLLMALGFAYMQMLTYATRENWKRRWDQDTKQLSQQLKDANAEAADLTSQAALARSALVNVQADLQRQNQRVLELESEVTAKEKDLENRNLQLSELNEQIQTQLKEIATLNRSLEISRTRQNELNTITNVSRAVTFKLSVKLAELEDDFNLAQTELQRRRETVTRLEGDLRRKDARLALVKERDPQLYADITSDRPVLRERIQGMVAAINRNSRGQQDLIMVTLGKDNASIERNMEFIIYRGDQYIAKVRVEQVLDNMAACRVIPEFWNTKGLEIEQGDIAVNRLM